MEKEKATLRKLSVEEMEHAIEATVVTRRCIMATTDYTAVFVLCIALVILFKKVKGDGRR